MNDKAFGFKAGEIQAILSIIGRFNTVQKAVIFGSRAKGNYKQGSDVDIAVWLEGEDITPRISGILNEETLLPYKFDVLNFNTIDNPDLIDHVKRIGIPFYIRDKKT